ncbi:hypothetical protein SAMN06295967_10925 [Belliella buryatensis]|uniref:Uncharacterized protein n=1 Tax=Belliella buryatensis TaxID=1500549 RepID=A0A239E9E0_9BACT|nr:hypothetical protein SAMN06295967_10925 [Belliella buryatensis]
MHTGLTADNHKIKITERDSNGDFALILLPSFFDSNQIK